MKKKYPVSLVFLLCNLIPDVFAIFFGMMKWYIPAVCLLLAAVLSDMWILLHGLRNHKKRERLLSGYLTDENIDVLEDPAFFLTPTEVKVIRSLKERLNVDKQIAASKKEAQLLALQNQINPHFLYNTLETIRSEAIIEGVDSVASMAEALATYFRYTISNLDSFVHVEDELNNVSSYFVIQHFRFGEKISLRTEYEGGEAEIMALFVPKLILQPVVENAIYHGLEEKLGAGEVVIRFTRTKKRLLICVSDNGIGMKQEQLVQVNRQFQTPGTLHELQQEKRRGGIALMNVHNRIRLLFGNEYGLHVESVQNVGTDVFITLPAIIEAGQETEKVDAAG